MSSEGIVTVSYKAYRNTYRLWKKCIVTPLVSSLTSTLILLLISYHLLNQKIYVLVSDHIKSKQFAINAIWFFKWNCRIKYFIWYMLCLIYIKKLKINIKCKNFHINLWNAVVWLVGLWFSIATRFLTMSVVSAFTFLQSKHLIIIPMVPSNT